MSSGAGAGAGPTRSSIAVAASNALTVANSTASLTNQDFALVLQQLYLAQKQQIIALGGENSLMALNEGGVGPAQPPNQSRAPSPRQNLNSGGQSPHPTPPTNPTPQLPHVKQAFLQPQAHGSLAGAAAAAAAAGDAVAAATACDHFAGAAAAARLLEALCVVFGSVQSQQAAADLVGFVVVVMVVGL